MDIFKKGRSITSINFYRWKKDLRILFILIITVSLIHYYFRGIVTFAIENDKTLTFCMLPALFMVSSVSLRTPKVVFHLGLILLLCDAPFFHPITPYAIMRSKRKGWWLGELRYIICVAFFYMGFLTIISFLHTLPVVTFENEWGTAIDTLMFGSEGFTRDEILASLDQTWMILYDPVSAWYFYPFACQVYTFITGFADFVILGLVIYCVSLVCKNGMWGVGMASMLVLLEPVLFVLDKATLQLMRFCPISWSTVARLNLVEETEQYLSIPYVTVMYIVLIVALILMSWLLSRKATIELR